MCDGGRKVHPVIQNKNAFRLRLVGAGGLRMMAEEKIHPAIQNKNAFRLRLVDADSLRVMVEERFTRRSKTKT